MDQEPIKNQWRVLYPEKPLSESACRLAHEQGFHAVVVEKEADVFPLKPVFKISSPSVSPFSPDFLKGVPQGKSLFWESALFTGDFRKELIDRALLQYEFLLIEIDQLVKRASRETIYYRIPDQFTDRFQERHLDHLLKRADASVLYVHSAVSGLPKRLDLPPHPLLARKHPRLMPLYHSSPLEGEWHQPSQLSADRFCLIASDGWFQRKDQAQEPLDPRLCYLQAIVQGEENPPAEELRLLADLLIAEMRYQQKRGTGGKQEQKRKLLIRALEKLRVPVPLSLTMD